MALIAAALPAFIRRRRSARPCWAAITGFSNLSAMIAPPLILVAFMVCAASSFGGEIYGAVKADGKPLAPGTPASILFGAKAYPVQIGELGSYRVQVAETGKGTAKIMFNGQDLTCDIQSYPTPVRFDLVIAKDVQGKYFLRRQ